MNINNSSEKYTQMPPLIFGGNVFGWTLDKKESFRMLDMLFERGITHIDTADSYGQESGLSEKIIGEWMKDRHNRDQIALATKGGRTHKKKANGEIVKCNDNSRTYLADCVENSLKRLQTDHIDLFYTHFDDEVTPIAEVLEAYYRLIKSGKIGKIGASNYSRERLKMALTHSKGSMLPKYEIFQTEYNLMERYEFEKKLKEVCCDYNVKVATYFSLASGFLTGKYRQKKDFEGVARQQLVEKYFNEKGLKVLQALDEISQEHNTTNAAVALAWILHRPHINSVVVSATKENHLDAFGDAIELKLSVDEMNRLNEASQY